MDPNSHLDVINKVEAVQGLLTKLRNRGTEVDTLTSGTGMVFTIKDLNECLSDFCRQTVKYCEKQMKSRSDTLHAKECHYQELLYVKDKKIDEMDRRLKNQNKNLDNLISARLFEKGNQLIFELDSCNRLVSLFKRNMYNLEAKIRADIFDSMRNKLDRDALFKEEKLARFKEYRDHLSRESAQDFALIVKEQGAKIKEMKNAAVVIDANLTTYKSPSFYPIPGNQTNPTSQVVDSK